MEYYEEAFPDVPGLYQRRVWEENSMQIKGKWFEGEDPDDTLLEEDGYVWFAGDKELDKWIYLGVTSDELPDDRFSHYDDRLYVSVLDHGISWKSIELDGGEEAKAIAAKYANGQRLRGVDNLTGEVIDIKDIKGREVKVLRDENDLTPLIEEFNNQKPGKFKTFVEFKDDVFGYIQWYSEAGELESEAFLNSFICETRSKVIHMGVSSGFFRDEYGRDVLLNKIMLPLVEGIKPEKVAICGPAWGSTVDDIVIDEDTVELIVMDQEIIQVYRAETFPDYVTDRVEVGEWEKEDDPDWEQMEFVGPVWEAMK